MTTTPQENDALYWAGSLVVGPETPVMEKIHRIRAGVEGDEITDEQAEDILFGGDTEDEPELSLQSFDPNAKEEEGEPESEPYRVQPMSADWMLEVWYLYQTAGPLASAKLMSANGGGVGTDEAHAAMLYVQDTPGFRREIVLFAQTHRGEADLWLRWYGSWPDNRSLAQVIYETFRAALAQRLHIQPFRIRSTRIFTPDHLEAADAANERDISVRNREWQRCLRGKP